MIEIDTEKSRYAIEDNYKVSMAEKDVRYAIKPAVLLNYMQDLAAKSIDFIGREYSCDALLQDGLGWFLIRYRIEFDDYPVGVSNVKVQTECRGANKMTTYRDFECFDFDTGKRLLRGTSSWFIVELENKSIVNINQKFPKFRQFEKRPDDLTLRKLRPIENADFERIFHVRYDDLDMNGHVNNTVYITWALEVLGYDFLCSHKLKNIDIYFKHEVRFGEDIISMAKLDTQNNISEHLIKNDKDEEVCLIKAEFINI